MQIFKKYSSFILFIFFFSGIILGKNIKNFFLSILVFLIFLISPFKYLTFIPLGNLHFYLNKKEDKNLNYPILLKKLNKYFKDKMEKNFESETKEFLLPLLLGERSKLNKENFKKFIRTGTLHFLAISGLHMTIITSIFISFFIFLRMNFKRAIIFSILGVSLYITIIPLRPSVLRAYIMIVSFLSTFSLNIKVHPLSIIGNAGFLSLILFPESAFDPGFHLSYLATTGIIVLFPLFNKMKIKNYFLRNFLYLPFSVSLSAQLFVFPYIYFFFKNISLIAPLSNIILSPLIFLSLLGGILSLISPFGFLTERFVVFTEIITKIIFFLLNFLSNKSIFIYTEKINYLYLSILIFLPLLTFILKIVNQKK